MRVGPLALITGITGQDGAYLAAWLLERGYRVVGGYRRTSTLDLWRLQELGIAERVDLVPLELLEFNNLLDVLRRYSPHEVYHLAAQSFVGVSFSQPLLTAEVTGLGTLRLLEALRVAAPEARFYQASTSEMFGGVGGAAPQDEATAFHPRSPYGVAKLFAHWSTVNAREAWGLHASCGILFNHESPLRGIEFVTRKITHTLAQMRAGVSTMLRLGNLEARRDWGYAPDYVRGMWLMLQQSHADDYVLATGESHTVREFVERAAVAAGFRLEWEGEGAGTVGRDMTSGQILVSVDPALYRPAEVFSLRGDPRKARERLGWSASTSFDRLIEIMVEADLRRVRVRD
jgi:GDPmannose 4,6-dehydratase